MAGLTEDDRQLLVDLTARIAELSDRLAQADVGSTGTIRDDVSAFTFAAGKEENAIQALRGVRPPLPEPRLIRHMIRQRQMRARFFDGELFSDPAWDILLDLAAARAEHRRVSVTSVCIASGVPPTTALRWISLMTDAGLLERIEDDIDRRRTFISLTDKGAEALARYFAAVSPASPYPV